MKNMMKTNVFWRLAALVTVLVACGGSLRAQDDWTQDEACPGWNNPQSFTDGNSDFFYSGRAGKKRSSSQCNTYAPSALTGETGFHDGNQGPFNNAPIIPAAQLGTYQISGGSDHAGFPNGHPQNYGFAIYNTTTQVTGHPVNRDPNTGDQLPYVPTHFNTNDTTPGVVNTNLTRSIRVGDAYGGTNATALYYHMTVNGDNAMLYIYYACVIESPASGSSTTVHGKNCDPAFIIRVMKKNAAGQWIQANPNNPTSNVMNDSLAYVISSTPAANQGWSHQNSYGGYGDVILNQTGQGTWHIYSGGSSQAGGGASYSSYKIMWKDWDKVALNLSPLYGEEVQIEVMVSDCCMTQHFAYGYLCGECRPMDIPSTGCPAGRSTNVTTLNAPRGLRSYAWEASEFGVSNPPLAVLGSNSHFTFRQVSAVGADSTEAANAQSYDVQASDFRVTKRRVGGVIQTCDSMGNQQTFRCRMRSALDPAKPFVSYMYANVTNTKPTMRIDTLVMCGGDVKLWNTSEVPGGDPSMVDMSTTSWKFYDTPNPTSLVTPIATMTGDSAEIHFDGSDPRYVLVRTNTVVDPGSPECYSEAVYPIKPKVNPNAGMTLSKRVLCDDEEATVYDTTSGVTYRRWSFRPENAPEDDDSTMVVYSEGPATAQNQSVTRSFSHAVEPIELYVRNGLFYVNRYNTEEVIYCADTAYDTVRVFTHPELEVTGDTIVCKGTRTNATVRAVGVDGCTYQWSKTLGTVTGGLPAGPTLQVEPASAVETYYVLVTSPQGCQAWDSIRVYLVSPTLTMIPANGTICPGDTVTLIGGNADHYTWTASPADPTLEGQDSADMVFVAPEVNTVYTMIGHGTNDCDADPLTKSVTVKPLPIPHVNYEPTIVDVDDPTILLRNMSEYSVGANWTFEGGETATGDEVTHTFIEATGADSVYVTLSPYNELNCSVDYRFGIPVNLYTVWFPNIFTPNSEDENSTFRLYTINSYEFFHIYVFNRRGEVVFESTDPEFVWDGTIDGVKCPQGTYVYVCRYRKPGMYTLGEQHGSVTLIR